MSRKFEKEKGIQIGLSQNGMDMMRFKYNRLVRTNFGAVCNFIFLREGEEAKWNLTYFAENEWFHCPPYSVPSRSFVPCRPFICASQSYYVDHSYRVGHSSVSVNGETKHKRVGVQSGGNGETEHKKGET